MDERFYDYLKAEQAKDGRRTIVNSIGQPEKLHGGPLGTQSTVQSDVTWPREPRLDRAHDLAMRLRRQRHDDKGIYRLLYDAAQELERLSKENDQLKTSQKASENDPRQPSDPVR